jgi:hypothetical protein
VGRRAIPEPSVQASRFNRIRSWLSTVGVSFPYIQLTDESEVIQNEYIPIQSTVVKFPDTSRKEGVRKLSRPFWNKTTSSRGPVRSSSGSCTSALAPTAPVGRYDHVARNANRARQAVRRHRTPKPAYNPPACIVSSRGRVRWFADAAMCRNSGSASTTHHETSHTKEGPHSYRS